MDALYEKSSIKVEKLLNATLNRYISFNDFSSNAPKEMYYQGFLNSVFSGARYDDSDHTVTLDYPHL